MSVAAPTSLADVRSRANGVYPTDLLADVRTAAMFFCAGFWGANDCVHVNDHAKLTLGIGVDTDQARLKHMTRLYEPPWLFWHGDAFQVARDMRATYDLVGVDPPTDVCDSAAHCTTWYDRAERLVVHGMLAEELVWFLPPSGWEIVRVMPRNDRARWVVSRRTEP